MRRPWWSTSCYTDAKRAVFALLYGTPGDIPRALSILESARQLDEELEQAYRDYGGEGG